MPPFNTLPRWVSSLRTEAEIEASATAIANAWVANDRNKHSEAGKKAAITQSQVVANYPGTVLSPEKVADLDWP